MEDNSEANVAPCENATTPSHPPFSSQARSTYRTEASHPRYTFPSSEVFHQHRKYSFGVDHVGCVTIESPKGVVPGVYSIGEFNVMNSIG